MHRFFTFLIALLPFFPAAAQSDTEWAVHYVTPKFSVMIYDGKLNLVTKKINRKTGEEEFKNDLHKISLTETRHLIRTVQNSGFMQLQNNYGVAEGQQSALFMLFVRTAFGDQKQVIYRKNKKSQKPPEAFNRIEKEILKLLKK